MQLITNQFSAEFGGHSAGVSSMITKTGTNQLAGSAFVMIRPGDLDAAPPLAPIVNGEKVKAPYNQQQFGGTAGGPIARDKIFFFGTHAIPIAAPRSVNASRSFARVTRPQAATIRARGA